MHAARNLTASVVSLMIGSMGKGNTWVKLYYRTSAGGSECGRWNKSWSALGRILPGLKATLARS